jgi:hypothetical protein
VVGALRDGLLHRWHNGSGMLLCSVLRRLALGAVIVHVCGLCIYVDYDPNVASHGLDYVEHL